MLAQIERIQSEEKDKIESAKACVEVCKTSIRKLREDIVANGFLSKEQEIEFFKIIKPKFHSRLLFYWKIYTTELNRPTGSKEVVRDFLLKEFYKLKLFFESHTSFYHYYRSGDTSYDEQYYTRHGKDLKGHIQFMYVDADPNFSTIYDYQVTRILRNEMLSDYLNKEIAIIESPPIPESTTVKPPLIWSDSKVAFAEMVYAFHASGVFNSSQADIKTVTETLAKAFNVQIGNIYKVLEEIRLRKKNRTVFLDHLKNNLIQRMDRDDEQAL